MTELKMKFMTTTNRQGLFEYNQQEMADAR